MLTANLKMSSWVEINFCCAICDSQGKSTFALIGGALPRHHLLCPQCGHILGSWDTIYDRERELKRLVDENVLRTAL